MADEQAALWNGPSGQVWVESQALLDDLFKPFEDLLVDAVSDGGARRVLDVGCGTGATSLAIVRSLGADGSCTGVDVSEPMLALARTRAEREALRVHFIRADAQSYAFEPDFKCSQTSEEQPCVEGRDNGPHREHITAKNLSNHLLRSANHSCNSVAVTS